MKNKKYKTARRQLAKTPWWPKGQKGLVFSRVRDGVPLRLRPVSEKELFATETKNKSCE